MHHTTIIGRQESTTQLGTELAMLVPVILAVLVCVLLALVLVLVCVLFALGLFALGLGRGRDTLDPAGGSGCHWDTKGGWKIEWSPSASAIGSSELIGSERGSTWLKL